MIIIYGSGGQDGRLLRNLLLEDRTVPGQQPLVGVTRSGIFDLRAGKAIADKSDKSTVVSFIRGLGKGTIEKIFYFAAHHSSSEITTQDKCSDDETMEINRDLPITLAEEAAKNSRPRFIYASSARIFEGYESPITVTEKTNPIPVSSYALSKSLADTELRHVHSLDKIDLTTVIFFGHESHFRNKTFLSAKIASGIVNVAREGRGCVLLGDPSAVLNWGHAEEYVRATVDVSRRISVPKLVIGAEELITVMDYVEACCRSLGVCPERLIRKDDSIKLRSSVVHKASLDLLANTIGWKPNLNIEQLAKNMTNYYLRIAPKK